MKGRTILFSSARAGGPGSARDDWGSPWSVREACQRTYGVIELDPCADADPLLGWIALNNYSGPAGNRVDGLREPWRARTVYINPPYSQARAWATRLAAEYAAQRFEQAILLVPSRTDTQAWAAASDCASALCLIRGRLRFTAGGRPSSEVAPFPSALLYFGPFPGRFALATSALGPSWKPLCLGMGK